VKEKKKVGTGKLLTEHGPREPRPWVNQHSMGLSHHWFRLPPHPLLTPPFFVLSWLSFDEDPMGFLEFYFLSISLGDNEMDWI
jgi:hypothetical protein